MGSWWRQLHLPLQPAGSPGAEVDPGECENRSSDSSDRRDQPDVHRLRLQAVPVLPGQDQRTDLDVGTGWVESSLPAGCHDRNGQEPGHAWRVGRPGSGSGGSPVSQDLVPCQRDRCRRGPVSHPPLSNRFRRHRPGPFDRWRWDSHGPLLTRWPIPGRHVVPGGSSRAGRGA